MRCASEGEDDDGPATGRQAGPGHRVELRVGPGDGHLPRGRVGFIDSAGLSVLVGAAKRAAGRQAAEPLDTAELARGNLVDMPE